MVKKPTKRLFDGEIELFSVEDLAKEMDIHQITVLRYIRSGKLKARKMGRRYFVSKDSLKEFFNGGAK